MGALGVGAFVNTGGQESYKAMVATRTFYVFAFKAKVSHLDLERRQNQKVALLSVESFTSS
jgi:hypothetical protein